MTDTPTPLEALRALADRLSTRWDNADPDLIAAVGYVGIKKSEIDELNTACEALATPGAGPVDVLRQFKNFHRSLCARFGYTQDEVDWLRDQVSLEEHIAKLATPAPVAANEPQPPGEYSDWEKRAYLRGWRAGVGAQDADGLIRLLGLNPERFRTDGGAINHMRLKAAIRHPDDYAGLHLAPPEAHEDWAFGWLVENGEQGAGLRYLAFDDAGTPFWTPDHAKAIRLCRREDAEQLASGEALIVVEHGWAAP